MPVVYTECGEADETYVRRFNLQWTIDEIDQIPLMICSGPRVAANIRRVYGYRGPIHEIPYLIQEPAAAGTTPAPHAGVVFGIVGRLVEHKGHQDVIAAVETHSTLPTHRRPESRSASRRPLEPQSAPWPRVGFPGSRAITCCARAGPPRRPPSPTGLARADRTRL